MTTAATTATRTAIQQSSFLPDFLVVVVLAHAVAVAAAAIAILPLLTEVQCLEKVGLERFRTGEPFKGACRRVTLAASRHHRTPGPVPVVDSK
jgi:hypothetical protein